MTHPHHHGPGCGHGTTQPPNPGNTTNPSVNIANRGFTMLLLLIVILIVFNNRKK